MDAQEYLRILRMNWLVILAITVLGAVIAGGATFFMRPVYTSSTELFVSTRNIDSVSELSAGSSFTEARVSTYAEMVTTPAVLQPVIEELELSTTPEQLAESVSAASDIGTVLVTISVDGEDPQVAAATASAIGSSLISVVEELERPADGEASLVELSTVAPAEVPTAPSAPNPGLNLALGVLLGLMLGVAYAVLRTVLDTRIRTRADLEKVTSMPVLGQIPVRAHTESDPLVAASAAHSPSAEAFQQLRTNLQFVQVDQKVQTVVVTSSVPGEGKSTTSMNLANSLARAGKRVVLVDADLRRPKIDHYLGLERNAGLTTALLGHANAEDLLQPWGEDGLEVLTSGKVPPNPSELLGSHAMERVVQELNESFDVVIIDSPPLLAVTDAAVLSQVASGIVLVVGADRAKREEIERSMEALRLVGAAVLGVVLNRVSTRGPDRYTYGYYQRTESPATPEELPSDTAVIQQVPAAQRTESTASETFTAQPSRSASSPQLT